MTLLDGLRRHHPFGQAMIVLTLAASAITGGVGVRMAMVDGEWGLLFPLALVAFAVVGLVLCRGVILWQPLAFDFASATGWLVLTLSVGGLLSARVWDLLWVLVALLALLWITYIQEIADEIPVEQDPPAGIRSGQGRFDGL